ncbi:SDR family NAD(P)-dependent oxidoreductase [Sandaracinus amylolyticus]|uniref:SDR family NAD(P)-dependent oxidoreductase n=1 Tax=Sandaracinus amylolyticus TaxID=927083 RepID=UPI001F3240DD|nr:SDR family NAD(P)-dependent oxidoreductase [Sandaracinus amylolyticus]UJR85888.1 Hypothetical protein I5071_79680 [Sandaracinus amylolyticus]
MKVSSESRLFVVTGPTSGIGRSIVLELARPGNVLVLVGRDREKMRDVSGLVEARGGGAEVVECDLGDLASVARAAGAIATLSRRVPLRGLVNNAGVQDIRATRTRDGVDTTFAVNHVASFALTEALLPSFDDGARVLFVASGVEDPDDPFARRMGFRGGRYLSAEDAAAGRWTPGGSSIPGQDAYASSKLCNVLVARHLAREVPASRVRFASMNPGFVPGTGLARDMGFGALTMLVWRYVMPLLARLVRGWSTPERAGRVVARFLGDAADTIPNGAFLDADGSLRRGSATSRDEALAARVVEETRALLSRLGRSARSSVPADAE